MGPLLLDGGNRAMKAGACAAILCHEVMTSIRGRRSLGLPAVGQLLGPGWPYMKKKQTFLLLNLSCSFFPGTLPADVLTRVSFCIFKIKMRADPGADFWPVSVYVFLDKI